MTTKTVKAIELRVGMTIQMNGAIYPIHQIWTEFGQVVVETCWNFDEKCRHSFSPDRTLTLVEI